LCAKGECPTALQACVVLGRALQRPRQTRRCSQALLID
jgi:hypothetical protein